MRTRPTNCPSAASSSRLTAKARRSTIGAGAARTASRSAAVPMPVPVFTHRRAAPVRVSSSVPTRPILRFVMSTPARVHLHPVVASQLAADVSSAIEPSGVAAGFRITAVGSTIATLSMLKSSSFMSSACAVRAGGARRCSARGAAGPRGARGARRVLGLELSAGAGEGESRKEDRHQDRGRAGFAHEGKLKTRRPCVKGRARGAARRTARRARRHRSRFRRRWAPGRCSRVSDTASPPAGWRSPSPCAPAGNGGRTPRRA